TDDYGPDLERRSPFAMLGNAPYKRRLPYFPPQRVKSSLNL
ncbi:4422_t:CDS:1, partial [Acaulospora colombiana]